MEFSLNRYYSLNRRLLSVIGIWPYQSAISAWICRGFAMLIITWTAIGQITKICITELTADFILDVLPILIPNVGVIMQLIDRMMNKNTMKELLDRIEADWRRTKSQDEIKIMHEYAVNTRLITRLFSFYVIGGLNSYMLYTIFPQILDVLVPLNESRPCEYPFHVEFFIDDKKYFTFIWLQVYLSLVIVLETALAHGTMFVVYTQHVSGMFTILGFVDIIQSSYELSLFGEFLSMIVLIGITMVQICKFSGLSDDRPLRSIAFVGGQFIYLFISSYAGHQIIDTSAQLFTKIYFGKWHNMSLWKQRMMLFVMMRCMQTISIRPFNHYIVSLESFSMIIQSSVSVCMLLRRF